MCCLDTCGENTGGRRDGECPDACFIDVVRRPGKPTWPWRTLLTLGLDGDQLRAESTKLGLQGIRPLYSVLSWSKERKSRQPISCDCHGSDQGGKCPEPIEGSSKNIADD